MRVPAAVMVMVGLAAMTTGLAVSGPASVVFTVLAALALVLVYLRGRRDVDEAVDERERVVEMWHRACVQLDRLRKEGKR